MQEFIVIGFRKADGTMCMNPQGFMTTDINIQRPQLQKDADALAGGDGLAALWVGTPADLATYGDPLALAAEIDAGGTVVRVFAPQAPYDHAATQEATAQELAQAIDRIEAALRARYPSLEQEAQPDMAAQADQVVAAYQAALDGGQSEDEALAAAQLVADGIADSYLRGAAQAAGITELAFARIVQAKKRETENLRRQAVAIGFAVRVHVDDLADDEAGRAALAGLRHRIAGVQTVADLQGLLGG